MLRTSFLQPPTTHGPVPFYWWSGEPLDRERIAWQLDQLCAKGVRQTVISYPHDAEGHTAKGDPELFSPAWWDLFRWFLGECKKRGMTVGFQDYTLVEPILLSIGQNTPGMQGGQMSCSVMQVSAGGQVQLTAEADAPVIEVWAYPLRDGQPQIEGAISLLAHVIDGKLDWQAPAGDWWVAMVFVRLNAFDPMHPLSGKLAIDQLYAPFERECPGELGKTLNLFFQDELGFGCRMPFWSNRLADIFAHKKGYELAPLLPALWHDLGAITEKVRLDYADAVVTTLEECYFRPIFEWHESRGVMFGHDNSGRGRMAQGRLFYGDYFRTMRWFSAPGCDDPKLHGPRAFKGLKVNSSIAHLYQRPRVWIEAFHSSGWGTQPADVMAALNEDFVYGATVVNLHGLYYSTRAGWWEWAPPDFHFRQPYWQHASQWNQTLTRLSWLLSQGFHRCDVGIVYPIESLDVEVVNPSRSGIIAHVENERVASDSLDPVGAEETAFVIGKHLFDHTCDFDFVDFESIADAESSEGLFRVRDAQYRVLVIPAMRAMRFSTLVKAREFVKTGGLVIAFGCLPKASERRGRDDAELNALLMEIFGSCDDSCDQRKEHPGGGQGVFFAGGFRRVLELIDASIDRDVVSSELLQVLHREVTGSEIYFLHNASDEEITSELRFRARGRCELWDATTGAMHRVADSDPLSLHFAARQARLVVIKRGEDDAAEGAEGKPLPAKELRLDGPWQTKILPTLDNRYGDFSLPASADFVGPQTREFLYCDEVQDDASWQAQDFDDRGWQRTTYSHGPQMEVAGPFGPQSIWQEKASEWLDELSQYDWQPYVFSRRWGVEKDPFLTDWLSGPHGLKGVVPDDYLDFFSEVPGSFWYVRAKVVVAEAGEHVLVTGSRCPYEVWINRQLVVEKVQDDGPGRYATWGIPHYESERLHTTVRLEQGENKVLIRLSQSEGQRTRAFVAFDPSVEENSSLALRWFVDHRIPRLCHWADESRRAIRFRLISPPGAQAMEFLARGASRAWAHGREIALQQKEILADGSIRYAGVIEEPSMTAGLIALRVEAPRDSHAGDALPEPVRYQCGVGQMDCGDWCSQGLACYSGMISYSRKIRLPELVSSVHLDLGQVCATAEVVVNGQSAATLLAPPWVCDLSPWVHPGENEITIVLANTLANQYRIGIPTPYAFSHQTPSGLMGPVTLSLR